MLQRLSLQFVFKKGWNQSSLWHQHSRSNNLLSDSKTWTWRGFRRNSFMWTTAYTNCSLPYAGTLVTQPMMQRRPNQMELRSMDSCNQILCRFQKSKQKVPPPSLPCIKKSPFTLQRMIFSLKFFFQIFFLWSPKVGFERKNFFYFSLLRWDGGGTFCLLFWNLHKIWI